jgi:ArsR family transcriptional regulator
MSQSECYVGPGYADDSCCPSLSSELSRGEAEILAKQLKALAEPARLQILSSLRRATDHEACVCQLAAPLGLSQPTVSHHLKVLHEAGLLERERRGPWIYYRLPEARLSRIIAALAVTSTSAVYHAAVAAEV